MSEPVTIEPSEHDLPKVVAPSLADLQVQVLAPLPPDADELVWRLHQRLREHAPRRARKPGEALEIGDEVECDTITLVDGHVLPGAAKYGTAFELREFVHLPGFLDELLTMTAFSAKTFELSLPTDYPDASVAGRSATFFVEVRQAFEVDSVEPDDSEALKRANLGQSVEEAFEIIASEIDRDQGDELLVEATDTVLCALAERIKEEIPEAVIDEELQRIWKRSDGAILTAKEFSPELISRSARSFMTSPSLRAQAEQKIRIGLALGALVESQGLAPRNEGVELLLQTAAEGVDVSYDEAKSAATAEPESAFEITRTALYLEAVEYVMSHAKVEVIDPDCVNAEPQVEGSID